MRRRGSGPELHDSAGPIELVAEHRCDDLGDTGAGCGCGGPGAAVMDDCRDPRKEDVVAYIAHGHAVGCIVNELEIGPASRDDDPAAHSTGGADQATSRIPCGGHAAEADKDRRFPTFEERFEVRGK